MTVEANLWESVESVEEARPPITPIEEDSSGCFRTLGVNLCKSVESVDRTPGPLSPPITPIQEDSVRCSQTPKRNLCKSVESVDRTPGPRVLDTKHNIRNLWKSVKSVDSAPKSEPPMQSVEGNP